MGMGGVSAGSKNKKMDVSKVIFLLTEKYYTSYNTLQQIAVYVWLHNALLLSQNLSTEESRGACVLPASARLLLEGVVASISLLPSALFWMPLSALFTVKHRV